MSPGSQTEGPIEGLSGPIECATCTELYCGCTGPRQTMLSVSTLDSFGHLSGTHDIILYI